MKHPALLRSASLIAVQFVVNATIIIVDPFDRTIDTFGNTEVTVINQVLKGYIESANPPDACTTVDPPSVPTNLTMKMFVLVNGTSECDLVTKIQNVAAVGYEVVILYDPFPEVQQYNITFPFNKSEVNVSVVNVLFEDGLLIKNNYLYQNLGDKDKMVLKIFPNSGTWMIDLLSFLVIISFAALPIFLIVLICVWRKNCNNNEHGREEVDEHAHGREEVNENAMARGHILMTSEEFKHICPQGRFMRFQKNFSKNNPLVQFSTDDRFDLCVICTMPFEVDEWICRLKCSHVYHPHCIMPWVLKFDKKKKCPLCSEKIHLESSLEVLRSDDATEYSPLLGTSCPSYTTSGNYSATRGSVNYSP